MIGKPLSLGYANTTTGLENIYAPNDGESMYVKNLTLTNIGVGNITADVVYTSGQISTDFYMLKNHTLSSNETHVLGNNFVIMPGDTLKVKSSSANNLHVYICYIPIY